jgi:hypothetical protein
VLSAGLAASSLVAEPLRLPLDAAEHPHNPAKAMALKPMVRMTSTSAGSVPG